MHGRALEASTSHAILNRVVDGWRRPSQRTLSCNQAHDLHLHDSKVHRSKAGPPCRRSCARPLVTSDHFELNPADTVCTASAFFLEKRRRLCQLFLLESSARPAWSASSSSRCSRTI